VRRESRSEDILNILVDLGRIAPRLPDLAASTGVCLPLCRAIETRNEVGQAFALDQDMLPKEPLGPVAVPGADRIDNALVLRQGIRHPAASPELEPPIGLEASMKLLRLFREKRVLAGFVDDMVEALVCIVVGVRVLLRCLPDAILVRFLELLLHSFGDPPGR
jgi:hypothetical protein